MTKLKNIALILILALAINSCDKPMIENSFEQALSDLKVVEDLKILTAGDAMIAVSPSFQGRVFASTAKGMRGNNIGYFNKKLLEDPNFLIKISELGGESRMWFGPEIGDYAVFYDPGAEQVDEFRKISPDLNTVHFDIIEEGTQSVLSGGLMKIRNASGYQFHLHAERKITLKTQNDIESELGIVLNKDLAAVSFCAETWIENTGTEQWKKETGLLSIWELGCMKTTPKSLVMIPTRGSMDSVSNYFTPLEGRIQIIDSVVYFRTDAAYMSKIGIPHPYSKDILGSYSPELNRLSIMKYHLTDDTLYVNSVKGSTHPYAGDVINIFNGDIQEERNWYLPFYEFESSSAVKELQPGEGQYHWQSLYHFEGAKSELNIISQQVLGINLDNIPFN